MGTVTGHQLPRRDYLPFIPQTNIRSSHLHIKITDVRRILLCYETPYTKLILETYNPITVVNIDIESGIESLY